MAKRGVQVKHEELLANLNELDQSCSVVGLAVAALRAVVELHKPTVIGQMRDGCAECKTENYPCPTIQAIEKELS
jgi:hypothetical protein